MPAGDIALEWTSLHLDEHDSAPNSFGSVDSSFSVSSASSNANSAGFGLLDAVFKLRASGGTGYALPIDPTKTYKLTITEQ
jgi:hypothetical protein